LPEASALEHTVVRKALNILGILSFAYLVSFLLVANFKTPLIGEDFALSPPFADRYQSLGRQLAHIAGGVASHSIRWSARLGDQLSILFLTFDKTLFNIANCFVFLVFCVLVLSYATGKLPSLREHATYYSLSIVAALVLLLMPHLGELAFWLNGALVYIWGITILLAFGLPYRLWFAGDDVFRARTPLVWLFYVLAILAGATNENTIPSILLFIYGPWIWSLVRKEKASLPTWYFVGGVLLGIGYAYLLLSPSTEIRQEYYLQFTGATTNDPALYTGRLKDVARGFLEDSWGLLIAGALAVAVSRVAARPRGKNVPDSQLDLLLYFFAACLLSTVLLVAAPYYANKASLLAWFALLCLIVHGVLQLRATRLYALLTPLLIVAGCWVSVTMLHVYSFFYEEAEARHYALVSESQSGALVAEVSPFVTMDSRLLNTREDWLRVASKTAYPYYYGLKEIIYSDAQP
jgi:hypothetical protein